MNKYKDISVNVNVVLNVLFISVHHELDKRQGTRTVTYLLWLAYTGNSIHILEGQVENLRREGYSLWKVCSHLLSFGSVIVTGAVAQ